MLLINKNLCSYKFEQIESKGLPIKTSVLHGNIERTLKNSKTLRTRLTIARIRTFSFGKGKD